MSAFEALRGKRYIPFLVSSISHLMMSVSGIPTSLASWTAPLPQRPSYNSNISNAPTQRRRATYSTDNQNLRRPAGLLLASLKRCLNRLNQKVLVRVGSLASKRLALRMRQLPGPVLDSQSGTCIQHKHQSSRIQNDGVTNRHNQQRNQKLPNRISMSLSKRTTSSDALPATRRPTSSVRNSRSRRVPPPRGHRLRTCSQPPWPL